MIQAGGATAIKKKIPSIHLTKRLANKMGPQTLTRSGVISTASSPRYLGVQNVPSHPDHLVVGMAGGRVCPRAHQRFFLLCLLPLLACGWQVVSLLFKKVRWPSLPALVSMCVR